MAFSAIPLATTTVIFIILSCLLLLSSHLARAQDRAPHGLIYENPMALSPSAFEFFRQTNTQQAGGKTKCAASNCSPFMPLAANVQSTVVGGSTTTTSAAARSRGMGAGGIAGVVFGFVFVVLLAMGVYYVLVTRRATLTRTVTVPPYA